MQVVLDELHHEHLVRAGADGVVEITPAGDSPVNGHGAPSIGRYHELVVMRVLRLPDPGPPLPHVASRLVEIDQSPVQHELLDGLRDPDGFFLEELSCRSLLIEVLVRRLGVAYAILLVVLANAPSAEVHAPLELDLISSLR